VFITLKRFATFFASLTRNRSRTDWQWRF